MDEQKQKGRADSPAFLSAGNVIPAYSWGRPENEDGEWFSLV